MKNGNTNLCYSSVLDLGCYYYCVPSGRNKKITRQIKEAPSIDHPTIQLILPCVGII